MVLTVCHVDKSVDGRKVLVKPFVFLQTAVCAAGGRVFFVIRRVVRFMGMPSGVSIVRLVIGRFG